VYCAKFGQALHGKAKKFGEPQIARISRIRAIRITEENERKVLNRRERRKQRWCPSHAKGLRYLRCLLLNSLWASRATIRVIRAIRG